MSRAADFKDWNTVWATLISANAAPSLWTKRIGYTQGGISGGVSSNVVRERVNDGVDATNGHETYTYTDGLGRVIQVRSESEVAGNYRITDTKYGQLGKPTEQTIPYFSSGSTFTTWPVSPEITLTEYDDFGRPWRVTPPSGDTGSPTGPAITAYNDGTDPWSRVVFDPEGKERRSYHDAYGRTVQIVDVTSAGNYTTEYEYNLLDNIVRVTDHASNETTLTYDSIGRKLAISDPGMGDWTYEYDDANRLKEQEDAKGQVVKFFYDADTGRLTSKEVYDATSSLVETITLTYDTSDDINYTVFPGQVYKVTDGQGWHKFSYDVRGRTLKSTRYVSKNSGTYTTETVYDDADRPVEVAYPGGDVVIEYTYDTGGNLVRVESTAGTGANEVFFEAQGFNALGQVTGIDYGNGLSSTYTYYSNSKRIQKLQTTHNTSGYLQDLTYTFDKVSNLKSVTDAIYSGSASGSFTDLVYDDLHRLTSATFGGSTKTYTYDAIGNILTNSEFGVGTYVYGSGSGGPHAVTSANGKNYVYDACGNMITRDSQTLTYDAQNRLARVQDTGLDVTFGYIEGGERLWRDNGSDVAVWIGGLYEEKDGKVLCHVFANGRRIATFEPITGMSAVIQKSPVMQAGVNAFMWPWMVGRAGWSLLVLAFAVCMSFCCVSVVKALRTKKRSQWQQSRIRAGVEVEPDVPMSRRFFGRNPWVQVICSILTFAMLVVGLPTQALATFGVADYDPVFYYYHSDHLGSSSLLTDREGDLVQHYESSAFGKERFKDNSNAFSVSHRYTGQILDEDTGLYYYGARYYDPEVARFTQADTIVPSATDSQSLNRYSYVRNNPLKYADPTGHFFEIGALITGILIGAAIGGATAAATGGNIALGALTGGISGGFGVVGGAAGLALFGEAAGGVIGAAAAGAASGAVSAAIVGGNVGMGALTGVVSGIIGYGFGKFSNVDPGSWQEDLMGFAYGSLSGGVGGGVGSVIEGGDFWDGAKYGAIGGAITYAITIDLPSAIDNVKSKNPRPHLFLDVFVDVVGIGYGVYNLVSDPSWNNAGWLVADVGAACLPGAVSPSAIKLGTKLIKSGADAAQAVKKSDNVIDAASSSKRVFHVDPKGNAIPVRQGESLTGSPNGRWLQVRDASGNPTGMRLDGGHSPAGHPDPRAQVPHGHVPGVNNADGTPWLHVK